MKKFKKSILLLTAITALAAMTMPAMASAAAKWGPVNTNGTFLNSVIVNVPGYSTGFDCLATLGYHVRTPASSLLDVTSASFTGCYAGSGLFANCTITMTATGLPWTLNGTTPSNIPISISASGSFSGTGCGVAGFTFTLSSSPPAAWGSWDAATHTVGNISGRPVTFTISLLGSPPATLTAAFRNPTQTLTLA